MKKVAALVLALGMLAALCACGGESDKKTILRLNEVTHSVFYAPQYVAMSQGFFADEGLEIELTNGGGADKVMSAVISGQSDIGLAGPEACIYVYNQGKDDYPRIFAQLTKRDGSFLMGRTDESFSWENLRGKTVIGGRAGGVPEMTLEYVLRQNGLVPQEDTVVDTSVQFNMMAGAFSGGSGDYVTLFEPTATEMELAGKGYILCSIGAESGEIPYTAYFASQSYMAAHPDVVQGFTNAIARAQKWILSHSDREVAEAIAAQFPDTSLDVLERVTARHRAIDAWNQTPVMEQAALERLETVMETAGELTRALADAELPLGVYLGMLTRTLMGVVPGVDGVHVLIDGKAVSALGEADTPDGSTVSFQNELMESDDFLSWIGAPVVFYDEAEQSGKLVRVRCVMREREQNHPRAQLETLFSRWNEANASAGDILAASVEAENVVINLSARFGSWLQTLEADAARERVYAMVNTLTQGRRQQGVIFFFDGKQIDELSGGLCMRGRLLRNPGMVVDGDGSMGVL